MVAEALARSFQHDYGNATTMLQRAEVYVDERNKEASRYWYLLATGVTAISIVACGLLLWIFRATSIALLGQGGFYLLLSSAAGAAGALLSVILRMGASNLDGAAGRRLHNLEGFFKVVCGTISGFLVALCVKAGILLPVFAQVDKTHLAMLGFGLIAGASERWAPSLITRAEGTTAEAERGPSSC